MTAPVHPQQLTKEEQDILDFLILPSEFELSQTIAMEALDKIVESHSSVQSRDQVLDDAIFKELRDFDYWFSARHVGGQSPIIPEVRQEIHRRMKLRTACQEAQQ